jgi:hypothetical protein
MMKIANCGECGNVADTLYFTHTGAFVYCTGPNCPNSTIGNYETEEEAIAVWNADQRDPRLDPRPGDVIRNMPYRFHVTRRWSWLPLVSCKVYTPGHSWSRLYTVWEWRRLAKDGMVARSASS